MLDKTGNKRLINTKSILRIHYLQTLWLFMNMNFLNNKNNNWIGLKTLILFMIVFLTVDEVQAQDKWRWLNPIPQGNAIVGIHFSSPDSGWFIAKELYKTVDGGQTWQLSENSPSINKSSMFFFNSSVAYIIGGSGDDTAIARTRDGGESWEIFSIENTSNTQDLYFISPDTGFVVTAFGSINWTWNGAEDWIRVFSDQAVSLGGIYFPTKDVGYASGDEGVVLKTINGGIAWESVHTGINKLLLDVYFITAEIGWVVGLGGTILNTMDGGNSWQSISKSFMSDVRFFEVAFLDTLKGYVTGSHKKIYSTINGGITWKDENIPEGGWNMSALSLQSDGTVIAGSENGMIIKRDVTTKQWSKLSRGTSAINFQSIDIAEDNTIFVGGLGVPDAKLYKSTDFGENWEPIALPGDPRVGDVSHDPVGNIYISGDKGKYYKSSDSGATWEIFEPPMIFWGMATPSVDTLFGFNGFYDEIYRTIDAGISWELVFENLSISGLTDIKFYNTMEGIAVGDGGFIATTNDGGETWQGRASGTFNDVNRVKYFNNEFLYAAGSWGTFLKSLDGGETWEVVNTGFSYRHFSVYFLDVDTGWISGDFGHVFKTVDGGASWTEEPHLSWSKQLSVIGVRDEYVIFAGQDGNIITNMPYGVVSVTDEGEYEPLKTPILRNYPNPFNPITTIEYSVEKESRVSLTVYNILGQEVAELVDGDLSPGNYSTILNASKWTSGIYISIITITELNTKREISLSNKMVLIK